MQLFISKFDFAILNAIYEDEASHQCSLLKSYNKEAFIYDSTKTPKWYKNYNVERHSTIEVS